MHAGAEQKVAESRENIYERGIAWEIFRIDYKQAHRRTTTGRMTFSSLGLLLRDEVGEGRNYCPLPIRSMIVAVAMPQPMHIVCRP
jgi:hypothetical protein